MRSSDAIALADYRWEVAATYARVRDTGAGESAWKDWIASRDDLFRGHSQSAIPQEERNAFDGLAYFPYDPAYRIEGEMREIPADPQRLSHSGAGSTEFVPLGVVSLAPLEIDEELTVYWLISYGGGIFLPFRDGTSGAETYGGGRYLLDSVKGAYLGGSSTKLILDFNYAYHPSCVYSDAWSCPLAPRQNHLGKRIPVGERMP